LCHKGWSPATLWHAARRNIGSAGLIGDFSLGQWYGL
jgi:hypothetical protein